jgi:hypothetical protein
MNKKISLKGFFSFSLEVFWPLLILWIPIIFIFGFGSFTMLLVSIGSGDQGDVSLAIYEICMVLFPIPLLFIAYLISRSSKIAWVKVLAIYFCWCFIFLIPFFSVSASFGGMVDGYVKNHSFLERHLGYLYGALIGTLFFQPIILVLTWFGFYKIKKIDRLSKRKN